MLRGWFGKHLLAFLIFWHLLTALLLFFMKIFILSIAIIIIITITIITITITTITNITISIPPAPVDSLAAVLRGEVLVSQLAPAQADDNHLSREQCYKEQPLLNQHNEELA